MGRFVRLFAIAVTHEYCLGQSMGLRFVPSAACAASMQREGLLLRHGVNGAEVWREGGAADDVLHLSFDVLCGDARIRHSTAWPVAAPLRFVQASEGQLLQAETLAGSGSSRQPLFSVEIAHRPADDGKRYDIALTSKKIHWKYFFSGSLAAKKLTIVDLDAAGDAPGLGFAVSPMPALDAGTAYTSEAALPMQRLPQQRLQLREEGVAGKVLIKRLPNADIAKLGKERGRDGRSMLVAEIYIHQ
jgi:hypothetical protein